MIDFDKSLTSGDIESGTTNVVVEIPTGEIEKIEWDREKTAFQLDRIEPTEFSEPSNYGFIPRTLNVDGNELDSIIISDEPMPTGAVCKSKIIGVMNFEDEGDSDDKIIVVPNDDRNDGIEINSIEDIPKQKIEQITHYFNHYKDSVKPNQTKVKGWGDVSQAKEIIFKSIERWNNQ